MFKEYPDIMNVAQVAQALHIGKKAVYDLINRHLLGCLYIGRSIKVPKQVLVEYVMTARNHTTL